MMTRLRARVIWGVPMSDEPISISQAHVSSNARRAVLAAALLIAPSLALLAGGAGALGPSPGVVGYGQATDRIDLASVGYSTLLSVQIHGGVTAAGVGLRNQGTGDISVSIPGTATVLVAYLYWQYMNETSAGGDASLDGNVVSGALTGGGSDGEYCWAGGNATAWRADVTSIVTGSGTYTVEIPTGDTSGDDPWPDGALKPHPLAEGASIVVVYEDPTVGLREIVIVDGLAVIDEFAESATATIPRPTAQAGLGTLTVLGADGQSNAGETMDFDGSLLATDSWDGSDPNGIGADYSNGNLWDTDSFAVNVPGSTSVDVEITSDGDCVGPQAFILDAPTLAFDTCSRDEKICKFVSILDGDGDGILEVGEVQTLDWTFTVHNPGPSGWTNVVVTDNFGGDLDITGSSVSQGSIAFTQSGATEKEKMKWDVGALASGAEAWANVDAVTDENPGGNQEWTSCGVHTLNSGATLKYRDTNGKQQSANSGSIAVEVFTQDLEGDCDGDGASDGDEIADGTDPFDPDTDDDGLLDGDETAGGCPDPFDPDSDDDGFTDGTEANAGSDPCDDTSVPT